MNKNIWGGILHANSINGDEKIQRVQTGSAELARLLDHWLAMPLNERPQLHGISAAPGSGTGPSLEILLSQGKGSPFAVLEISPSHSFPRPSAVWPFSAWWEEELRTFRGIQFNGPIPEGNAQWRPL